MVNQKRGSFYPGIAIITSLLLVMVITSYSYSYEIDTTKIREMPRKNVSMGEAILEVPSFILTLPVYIIEGAADFTTNQIVLSRFGQRVLFITTNRRSGLNPVFGYGPNSGSKAGVLVIENDIFAKGENMKLKITHSIRKYQTYSFLYLYSRENDFLNKIGFELSYRKKPRENFYGIGNESSYNNEVSYNLEHGVIGASVGNRLLKNIYLDLDVSYQVYNLYNGENPDLIGDLDTIRQRLELSADNLMDSRILTFSTRLLHDWRNHPGRTTAGGYESGRISYIKGVRRSEALEYIAAELTLRQFLHLYRERVLVFTLLAKTVNRGKDSPQLPFYLLPNMGGGDDLLAYRSRRFIDNAMALSEIEYRYPILTRADGFLFFQEGRVFDSLTEDFKLKNWHYSTGFGLRFWNMSGMIFCAQVAFGRESPRYYVQFSDEL
jgi:hypothetical protein